MFYQETKRLKHDYGELEEEVIKLRDIASMSQRIGSFDLNENSNPNFIH